MIRLKLDLAPCYTDALVTVLNNPRGKRPIVTRSRDARNWMDAAVGALSKQKEHIGIHTIEGPVALSVDVFRERNAGQIGNVYTALSEALRESGIIRDHRLIVEHRRCRILTDARRPRYEIILWPLEAQGVLIPLDADPGPTIPDVFKLPGER